MSLACKQGSESSVNAESCSTSALGRRARRVILRREPNVRPRRDVPRRGQLQSLGVAARRLHALSSRLWAAFSAARLTARLACAERRTSLPPLACPQSSSGGSGIPLIRRAPARIASERVACSRVIGWRGGYGSCRLAAAPDGDDRGTARTAIIPSQLVGATIAGTAVNGWVDCCVMCIVYAYCIFFCTSE